MTSDSVVDHLTRPGLLIAQRKSLVRWCTLGQYYLPLLPRAHQRLCDGVAQLIFREVGPPWRSVRCEAARHFITNCYNPHQRYRSAAFNLDEQMAVRAYTGGLFECAVI